MSQQENKTILIDSAIAWVNAIQDKQTGCWFRGAPSLQQKINGAMKILTGFKVAQKMHIRYPEKLIDFALSVKNDQHACDHFNVIYVLKYAGEASHSKYRHQEIQDFALERLGLYQKYYWKEFGGFSFFLGKSNEIYYNARITKGLAEPDIHGTTLFLWGIALIAQLLGIEKELGFKEFVT